MWGNGFHVAPFPWLRWQPKKILCDRGHKASEEAELLFALLIDYALEINSNEWVKCGDLQDAFRNILSQVWVSSFSTSSSERHSYSSCSSMNGHPPRMDDCSFPEIRTSPSRKNPIQGLDFSNHWPYVWQMTDNPTLFNSGVLISESRWSFVVQFANSSAHVSPESMRCCTGNSSKTYQLEHWFPLQSLWSHPHLSKTIWYYYRYKQSISGQRTLSNISLDVFPVYRYYLPGHRVLTYCSTASYVNLRSIP